MSVEGIERGDAAGRGSDVHELRRARHVPCGVDPLVRAALRVVDGQEPAVVAVDLGGIKVKIPGPWVPSGRDQKPLSGRHGARHGQDAHATAVALNPRGVLLHHRDAVVGEYPADELGELRFRSGSETADDGDGDAKVGE